MQDYFPPDVMDQFKKDKKFVILLKDYWFHYSRKKLFESSKFFNGKNTKGADVILLLIRWKMEAIDLERTNLELEIIHSI